MTHEEALADCGRLAREHPDRAVAGWIPREEQPGEWVVVRVPRPGRALNRDELRAGQVDDVRPDPSQDVPQQPRVYWG